MRPELSDYFIELAKLAATRGTCERAKVGAVLVRGKHVVGTGYNGAPPGEKHCDEVGCDRAGRGRGCGRTTHAEANAIAFAARHGVSTDGAELYTTTSPCLDCAKLILSAGIVAITYDVAYRDASGVDLLARAGLRCTGRTFG